MGRRLGSLRLTAATQSQPSGRAPPPLITASAPAAAEHAKLSLKVDPFEHALENALTGRAKFIVHKRIAMPSEVIIQRAKAAEELERAPRAMDRFQEPRNACLHYGSPARKINLPLIHLISRTLAYRDIHFALGLALGMPIVGGSPSRMFPGGARRIDNARKLEGICSMDKEIVELPRKYQERDLAAERWAKALVGIQASWISAPVPLNDLVARAIPLAPRLAIEEERRTAKGAEIRLMGDFRAIGVNDIAETRDAGAPGNLYTPLAISNFYKNLTWQSAIKHLL